jgi:glycine cleavage system H protein
MKPEQLLYAKTHEWVAIDDQPHDRIATIGVSAFAIEQLTDLVYMQLPQPPRAVKVGDSIGEIESVKAVSDIYSPVEGDLIEVNEPLKEQLETLGKDPYGAGWIAKIRIAPGANLDHLLDHAAYQKQIAAEG